MTSINLQILDKIPLCYQVEWPLFSSAKLKDTINKYSSLFTLGLDPIS